MDHFSNVDRPFASATVITPAYACEGLLKLYSIDFRDNPLVTEISKSPHLNNQNTILNLHYSPHQSSGLYIAMEMQ